MTAATSDEPAVVVFRGGFSAPAAVVRVLLTLEARGARFELKDGGGFRVRPVEVLTAEDTAFLRAHRDEARRVIEYQGDDAHLFSDSDRRQSLTAQRRAEGDRRFREGFK